MAKYNLILPQMGEGVMEAKIINWIKKEGDFVNIDDSIVEIATDKVDSEVPTEVSGVLIKILKQEDETVQIGETLAIIETDKETSISKDIENTINSIPGINKLEHISDLQSDNISKNDSEDYNSYLSPLIKSIIKKENISKEEIKKIKGTGLNNRITKEDIKLFLENKTKNTEKNISVKSKIIEPKNNKSEYKINVSKGDEVIEMDRMRSLISNYMVESKKISPHVTSFMEADVTNIVYWREKNKDIFLKQTGEKLTFSPLLVQAIIGAIKEFPMINISVIENKIIKKKNINIGIATTLPTGNLIVPVIKNADTLSIVGLAKNINDLAGRARNNTLKPHEITEGTYTFTNIGTFGNIMGTPIINQPQVAIMAAGIIQKKVSVIETSFGDQIGIRHKMYLSHTYDHRVIDGSLGGLFLKKVCENLENFDLNFKF